MMVEEFAKKLFKVERWPPISLPFLKPLFFLLEIVVVIGMIVFGAIVVPFIFIKPFFKWLFGRWDCMRCKRTYGVKTKRESYYGSKGYVCEYCLLADKLEG